MLIIESKLFKIKEKCDEKTYKISYLKSINLKQYALIKLGLNSTKIKNCFKNCCQDEKCQNFIIIQNKCYKIECKIPKYKNCQFNVSNLKEKYKIYSKLNKVNNFDYKNCIIIKNNSICFNFMTLFVKNKNLKYNFNIIQTMLKKIKILKNVSKECKNLAINYICFQSNTKYYIK